MNGSEALKSVAVIRDAFGSVREQFRDEQYVIDSIIAGLNIAIRTLGGEHGSELPQMPADE